MYGPNFTAAAYGHNLNGEETLFIDGVSNPDVVVDVHVMVLREDGSMRHAQIDDPGLVDWTAEFDDPGDFEEGEEVYVVGLAVLRPDEVKAHPAPVTWQDKLAVERR